MIPLIGFLVYENSNKSLKTLGLWFIPVILIPLIWPTYAAYTGNFDEWFDGVIYQVTEREALPVFSLAQILFGRDPVLLILGTIGIGFVATMKRDLIPLLWVGPILLFFYSIHFFRPFHIIPLLPSFCIAAGVLIENVSKRIQKRNFVVEHHLKYPFRFLFDKLPFIIVAGIAIFGFLSITMVIITDVAYFQSKAVEFVAGATMDNEGANNKNKNNNNEHVTVITTSIYLWIFKYIFHIDNALSYKSMQSSLPVQTVEPLRVIMMVDSSFKGHIEEYQEKLRMKTIQSVGTSNLTDNNVDTRWTRKDLGSWIESDLGSQNVICSLNIAWYRGNERSYNFVLSVSGDGTTFKDVYSGKSSGTTLSGENYDLGNVTAKYIKITVNGNSVNSLASITEINVYGYVPDKRVQVQSLCDNLTIKKIKTGDSTDGTFDLKVSKSKRSLVTLYENTHSVAKFDGTAKNYNMNQYPYTSLGYNTGGSRVDVRTNFALSSKPALNVSGEN